MNTHSDTPVYDQAFNQAVSDAIDIDNMDQLTILENMNSDTAIQPAVQASTSVPF